VNEKVAKGPGNGSRLLHFYLSSWVRALHVCVLKPWPNALRSIGEETYAGGPLCEPGETDAGCASQALLVKTKWIAARHEQDRLLTYSVKTMTPGDAWR